MVRTARQMLPTKPPRPEMVNTGVSVPTDVLEKLDSIVRSERVKSRNQLIASFLAFDVELFPHMKMLEPQIQEVERAENCTRVEALALLLRRGLAAYDKEKRRR